MTYDLMMTPVEEALLASTDPARVCLITDQASDAAFLSERAGYPVKQWGQFPSDLSEIHLLIVPIGAEGFFELLERVADTGVKMIAIVNDLAEEFSAARLLGLRCIFRDRSHTAAPVFAHGACNRSIFAVTQHGMAG